jgi:3,4-dihydroxy 2-butanone 4-phosphate synthase/GTP cyclohydrolase II
MCPIGDVFGTPGYQGASQLREAARVIEEVGLGVILYVFPRGRTSLAGALAARTGTVPDAPQAATLRDFGLGAQVLYDLGLRKIRLATTNPKKIAGITGYGIEVVEQVPIASAAGDVIGLPVRRQGRGD